MTASLGRLDELDYLGPPVLRRSLSQPFLSAQQFAYRPRFSPGPQPPNPPSDSADSVATDSFQSASVASSRLSCSSVSSSDASFVPSDCDDDLTPAPIGVQDQFFLYHEPADCHILGLLDHLQPPTPIKDEFTYILPPIIPPPAPPADTSAVSPTVPPPVPPAASPVAAVLPADLPSATPSCPNSRFWDRVGDDSNVQPRPWKHVDYLSYDWIEEDIWSSWRYVKARRHKLADSARLENASWRSWVKSKNNLQTVPALTLNWLKEGDITWLYGPLQPARAALLFTPQDTIRSTLSHSDSFVNKKPILKKRTGSEIMLQRFISSSSLLKQATAAVQAQESDRRRLVRPDLGRSCTDYDDFSFASRPFSCGSSDLAPSSVSSGVMSPTNERRHIHFNEQVEQCIAVEVKGESDFRIGRFSLDDSDSSDCAVMMKRTRTKKRNPIRRKPPRDRAGSGDGKTIAKLPSTKLKSLQDTVKRPDTAMKHSIGTLCSPILSPSSSQETLRPSKSLARFVMDDDGDDAVADGFDALADWDMPNFSGPPLAPAGDYAPTYSASTTGLDDEPAGMRRTSSGMFMPWDADEPTSGEGLFGRVIDTVNTARDIAHVIWNVGWRK